jgi:Adenylate and Guanylate cyclase catalytic domain
MLVEFPSAVNAIACAVEIQCRMGERNRDVPQDQRIEFRIGVNLGDIIFEDIDIFGDGVNVAARIESIAKPGGVSVSGSVRDNVGNRLDLAFEDTGEPIGLPFYHAHISACHAELGHMEEAQAHTKLALKVTPNFSVRAWGKRLPYKSGADLQRFPDGLRKVGLPEWCSPTSLVRPDVGPVMAHSGNDTSHE